ncbi:phage portal protein [Virgibacillus sp. Bac330]|uniref:phage portal protein n=1 Tax=Virgibacillus sp. Bac330 TaxID=2419841 RepID=UPI000EF506E2|nr:phage portal protein [Virgibacillus sp. Bac330]
MNPEIGSIMGFFYKVFPVKIYELAVPTDFVVPSMYFPSPRVFDGNDSNQTYMKTYNLSIKLFHHDSKQAYREAENIAEKINGNRNVIPLLDIKGLETGDYIRFTRVEVRIGDRGVANIILHWDSRYYYHQPEIPAIQYLEFESGVK